MKFYDVLRDPWFLKDQLPPLTEPNNDSRSTQIELRHTLDQKPKRIQSPYKVCVDSLNRQSQRPNSKMQIISASSISLL